VIVILDFTPASDSAINLHLLSIWMADDLLDPLVFYDGAVRANPDNSKVIGDFQCAHSGVPQGR
jgi:hypothetical protein